MATMNDIEYMSLPKMAGLAEAAWSPTSSTTDGTPSQVNWKSLAKRLGCGQQGLLNLIYNKFEYKYRGSRSQQGIAKELPPDSCSNNK